MYTPTEDIDGIVFFADAKLCMSVGVLPNEKVRNF